METSSGYLNYHQHPSFGSSRRDVSYSCGSCGYELNLNSSSRNTASIGSKYGKSIKKADASDTASGSEASTHRKYDIKIRSLQPSSSASGTPLPE
ncbi:PREDICTED: uncharacterized protein At4g08330, chloroplastic-like isoform X2 [Nicotiana attenuata]|uniref:uncharacterized protein At4g08330, chloroplastic-like isoform X2 n=1 Tax=Nicotiana attenuata TaxID=49451 RepID=UPI000904AFD6|nr:PREDICTED: uncharacterized protein At4g08330, chloroplastic-like isoform X2 [Nicotiana attenuata]